MCSFIHKLMNPDEDFTAITENIFPTDFKVVMVVTNVSTKYLTISPKQMFSSVKFTSTQRTFMTSAED